MRRLPGRYSLNDRYASGSADTASVRQNRHSVISGRAVGRDITQHDVERHQIGRAGLRRSVAAAAARFGYVAIPKNARSPNASILYALWYASPEGQDAMRQYMGYDMTDLPGSRYAKEIAGYIDKGYKFRDVTVAWWGSQKGVIKQHRRNIKLLRSKVKR